MREGYRFTGADVSSLEFAIETSVQSDEEDEENVFPPGSINYVLDQIREMQSRSPLTPLPKTPARNRPRFPLFQAPSLSPLTPVLKNYFYPFLADMPIQPILAYQPTMAENCSGPYLVEKVHTYRQLSIQMSRKWQINTCH